jgi:predicted component of type VI protein secretion system
MMNKAMVKLGRGHDCDVRISDISVSRFHATVKLVNSNFYIEDHKSKFGTLIQVKRPVMLEITDPLTFQIGRSLIHIMIKRPWSLIPACFRTEHSKFDPYNMTANPGDQVLLPINSGIPLSCTNPADYLQNASLQKAPESRPRHANLLHNHNQLGANSSCEEVEEQNSIEEVDVYMPDSEAVLQSEADMLSHGEDGEEVLETVPGDTETAFN